MALPNNLIVRITSTSRPGGVPKIGYDVFRADGVTRIYSGGIEYPSAQWMRDALIFDKADIDEALEIVLRSVFSADGQQNAAAFDALAGKTFRVQSRAVEI